MLNRISSGTLIKLVLTTLSAGLVLILAFRVWDSVQELNSNRHILGVVDASGQAFKVTNYLRIDRASSTRAWNGASPITPEARSYIIRTREPEMSALRESVARLPAVEFPQKATLLPVLNSALERLVLLQAEFWVGVDKPKAERRPELITEYVSELDKLATAIEQLGAALMTSIRYQDALVDQMMQVKQLAWLVRNYGGDASVAISMGLASGRMTEADKQTYGRNLASARALWRGVENTLAGMSLSPQFSDVVKQSGARFFDADHLANRERLIDALIAGTKPTMTAEQFAPDASARLSEMFVLAEAALAEARQQAINDAADATRAIVTQAGLLIGALLVAAIGMLVINGRVIRPLHALRDAMLRIANGNLSVVVPGTGRSDEVGALAGALETFQQQAREKALLEADQRVQQQKVLAREKSMTVNIQDFELDIGHAIQALAVAADQMTKASGEMTGIATRSTGEVEAAELSTTEASANVATIAAASEQLSASIAEISRQVSHASRISSRAVEETRRTDGTVRGMAESAGKIGDVVRMITDIANQTNLLALNATIEAARAGDAGKGFAVVASEVKTLAGQTARATEEIASQIAAVQAVTSQAVEAIRQIGITIEEVSEVAGAIAANVEQQGSATQEIVRNTQEASRRTQESSDSVAHVRQGATATGETANAVWQAARAVEAGADTLRTRVNGFLANIRAA